MAPDQNLTVIVHDSLESLDPLRAEWEALLSAYPLSTVFSTLEWLVSWWRAFGGQDRLVVLGFRNESLELVGLAPFAVTVRHALPFSLRVLRMMGDGSHDSDNLDLPVRPGCEEAVTCRLLDWMQQKSALWDVCELNTLPGDSFLASRLMNELAARQWKRVTSTRPQTVVELDSNWEGYLKKLSRKERGKIGLRARRLEKRFQVRIRRCSDETDIDAALQSLFELHRKHWQQRGLPGTLHSPARRQFYGELARLLLAHGRLEFWILELNGKIAAAQFGLRYGTTVFSLQEGFDPEYFVDSVGYVLRSEVLKRLIGDGVRRYDFLGGTDESKVRWGGELKHYLNLHFARPASRGGLHLALKARRGQGKEWLRDQLPAGVWRWLKSMVGKEK